jgi:polyhydroxybutyrate depolymerase
MSARWRFAALASLLGAGCVHAASRDAAVDAPGTPPEAAAAPHTDALTVPVEGQSRAVILHVPGGAGNAPLPLVFSLHGSGGSAAGQEAFTTMDAAADAAGFIVAYPQGALTVAGGFAWNVPGQPLVDGSSVPPGAQDDAVFIAQAIAFIEARYPVDPKRIYATGMSGGARMASQLGCDLASVIAAVAPVAGLRFPSPCAGQRPVPVIAFHGTADTTNPYDGGGPPYWTYSVPSAAQQWATHDACGTTPVVSQVAASVQLTSYPDCAAGSAVDLYTIDGAGHEWPGAPGQNGAIDATAVMWQFFKAHPLP